MLSDYLRNAAGHICVAVAEYKNNGANYFLSAKPFC